MKKVYILHLALAMTLLEGSINAASMATRRVLRTVAAAGAGVMAGGNARVKDSDGSTAFDYGRSGGHIFKQLAPRN